MDIKRYIDQLYVIFSFEKSFFKKFDYEVQYVGNPLLDAITNFVPSPTFITQNDINPEQPIVALLPGSRKQEVEQMLALMLSIKKQHPDYQFIIAGVSNLDPSIYAPFLTINDTKIVYDAAYDLLTVATAALVTSGTATLETALFNVPQVVCYKSSWLSFQIAKRLIRVPYISLVNLIAEKEVVKELIQDELTSDNLSKELTSILPNGVKNMEQLAGYQSIRASIGEVGASGRAAQLMVDYLKHGKL